MAIIKCKMCGGDLELAEGASVAQCAYCGTTQTVPSADSEKKTGLFLRAEKLRRDCDFDRAAAVYDSILTDFPAEPEAWWGLLLCRYGIEYVDDPATGKKVPTCHRSSFACVMQDEDLKKVMEYADAVARKVYREEARAIEEIRKVILEVSEKEPPYDIFLCYKETDDKGERTVDSVLAQDVYDALTEKGYRVFFARITLEDKLGQAYEPYIFAALNSAKVMLVFGTDYEYFNAVWVKNEWSRYLKLMAQDKSKHLIPCYKDIDAYDLPEEFQALQGQDLGKVGAVQDLLRGVEKLLPRQAAKGAEVLRAEDGSTLTALLKRGSLALEDGDWESADRFFEKALNLDAECGEAYWGKALAEQRCRSSGELIVRRCEDVPREEVVCCVCPEAEERIERAVRAYTFPGYQSAKEIRNQFRDFPRTYSSRLPAYRRMAEREREYFTGDRWVGKAVRYGDEALQRQISDVKEQVLQEITAGAARCEAEEQAAAQRIREGYAEHLNLVEARVAQQFAGMNDRRETDYRRACEDAKRARTVQEYRKLIGRFQSFGDYRDSRAQGEQCAAAMKKLQDEEAQRVRQKEERAKTRAMLERRKEALNQELGRLGLFSGTRKREIAAQLAQIEAKLKKL